jgi:hypothetical protein
MIYIIDAFEIVLGPFRRISVISNVVASSDEWCDNNASVNRRYLPARVRIPVPPSATSRLLY